jgi:hypothetical protein
MGAKLTDRVFILVAEIENEVSDTYSEECREDEIGGGHLRKLLKG